MTDAATLERPAAKTLRSVIVTPDNFVRAETDWMFDDFVSRGAGGKFLHHTDMPPLDGKGVRPNRDTLYSVAVFDLDAGPVTVTLPDAGERYMAIQVIDEDHYVPKVIYDAGDHVFTREKIGTRYVCLMVRTLVDPNDPADIAEVQRMQQGLKVQQHGGPGTFEFQSWDEASHTRVRGLLKSLGETLPDMNRSFGTRQAVDPVRHLIGAASGWGGNPEAVATYLMFAPARNDGKTDYRLKVPADVPVDAFWSISVYDGNGYFVKNERDAYTVNNIIAKKDADGSVTVQFGGCDGSTANCLPIFAGWNYLVRLYRPRPEVLDGSWKFPEPEPQQG